MATRIKQGKKGAKRSQKHKTREWLKEETRQIILKELDEDNLSFGKLLERSSVSRGTLNTHLKEMLKNGEAEKVYDLTKEKNVYGISQNARMELAVEGMIENLGKVAVHQLLKMKLHKSVPMKLEEAFEKYLKALEDHGITTEQLLDFIEKRHPLVM
jgi:DNA-binding transcriptional ArsR family regulator